MKEITTYDNLIISLNKGKTSMNKKKKKLKSSKSRVSEFRNKMREKGFYDFRKWVPETEKENIKKIVEDFLWSKIT